MKLFGRSSPTQDELRRQAAEELDSAVANAKPPTDAERTWVLPLPDPPDLRPRAPRRRAEATDQPRRPATSKPATSKPAASKPAASKPAGRTGGKATAKSAPRGTAATKSTRRARTGS